MIIERQARETLTALEMNRGDELRFTLKNGEVRSFVLEDCSARVLLTNLRDTRVEEKGGGTMLQMDCRVRVDGQPMQMRRYVCAQESFYEPYVVNGLRIWFDAVADLFYLIEEHHGPCRPEQHARFAFQDATLSICPERVHLWCPREKPLIDAHDCYNGDDCWLGPYRGASAHGGLDINHRAGTPLFAPIDLDDQYYYNSVASGYVNNRWRGVRRWPDGSVWTLQVAHIIELTVPEHTPLKAGGQFAKGAGVWVGDHQHSHFIFQVTGQGGECRLDPWIIFRQAFEDLKDERGDLRARMAPVAPARTGEAVKFSPAGSRPGPGGGELAYFWTFGDGGASNQAEPQYIFTDAGIYPVTLTVEDGVGRAACTQHITVNGESMEVLGLALDECQDPSFRVRLEEVMDVYGAPPLAPRTLRYTARPSRPTPEPIEIDFSCDGDADRLQFAASEPIDWLQIALEDRGVGGVLSVSVDATDLAPGRYSTAVRVVSPEDVNSPEAFRVELIVPESPPSTDVVIRVGDPGFYATPYFWLAPPFHNWPSGCSERWLTNGGRQSPAHFCRFTPDLAAGTYEVSLADETPFERVAAFRREGPMRFAVRVRHAGGDSRVWVEPLKSRRIGIFPFEEGTDGYVEIRAGDSAGQVLVDAVRFRRIPD